MLRHSPEAGKGRITGAITAFSLAAIALVGYHLIDKDDSSDRQIDITPPETVILGEYQQQLDLVLGSRNYPEQPFTATVDNQEIHAPFGVNIPVPGTSASETVLIGGGIEARVDLSTLSTDDIFTVRTNTDDDPELESKLVIEFDPPALGDFHARPVETVAEGEGALSRFGDVFTGNGDSIQQSDLLTSATSFFEVTSQLDSELFDTASSDLEAFATDIGEAMGFDNVEVRIRTPRQACAGVGTQESDERTECLNDRGYLVGVGASST